MSLLAVNEIVQMYDELGLSVEAIAEEMGYDPLAVRTILLQKAKTFLMREQLADDGKRQNVISKEDDQILIETAKILAISAEDERVRADMIKYLHDEHMGRNDKQQAPKIHANITLINAAIKQARAVADKSECDMIDVTVKEEEAECPF